MFLIVGDLHFSDRAADAHRFGIFKWIAQQQNKRSVIATFLLGDLTDQKDRHSASLVNKIVSGLVSLRPPVYIVRGNHDYKADQSNPFFKFLNHIEGLKFVGEPSVIREDRNAVVAMIPHYRSQDEFNNAVAECARHKPSCFLVHQTFDGAIAETGVRLSGLSASPIESLKPPLGVYAGDVHRPQTHGLVTYVGCPYQVRFGDNFEPRSIWLSKEGTEKDLAFAAPRKWSLTVRGADNLLNNEELVKGDQVKLTIEVAREEAVEWKQIKQEVLAACKKLKLEVYGAKLEIRTNQRRQRLRIRTRECSLADTLEQFCKSENVSSQIKKTGMEIVNGN